MDGTVNRFPIRTIRIFFALVAASVFLPISAWPQNLHVLTGEFWLELEPHVRQEGRAPQSAEERIELLLSEAQYVFSGMIYGFSFRYVPLDLRRNVTEELEVKPVATILRGDPALAVVEARIESGRHFALIRYHVREEQRTWVDHWSSNLFERATGYGTGDMLKGEEQKRIAIENGIREAIRAYLRPREYNKPKEISGFAAFVDVPYVVIDEGHYRAKVSVKLDIRDIVPYRLY